MRAFEAEVVHSALDTRLKVQGQGAAIKQLMGILHRLTLCDMSKVILSWKECTYNAYQLQLKAGLLGQMKQGRRAVAISMLGQARHRLQKSRDAALLHSWSRNVLHARTDASQMESHSLSQQAGMRSLHQIVHRWESSSLLSLLLYWRSNMTELAMVELQGEITNVLVGKLKYSRKIAAVRWISEILRRWMYIRAEHCILVLRMNLDDAFIDLSTSDQAVALKKKQHLQRRVLGLRMLKLFFHRLSRQAMGKLVKCWVSNMSSSAKVTDLQTLVDLLHEKARNQFHVISLRQLRHVLWRLVRHPALGALQQMRVNASCFIATEGASKEKGLGQLRVVKKNMMRRLMDQGKSRSVAQWRRGTQDDKAARDVKKQKQKAKKALAHAEEAQADAKSQMKKNERDKMSALIKIGDDKDKEWQQKLNLTSKEMAFRELTQILYRWVNCMEVRLLAVWREEWEDSG